MTKEEALRKAKIMYQMFKLARFIAKPEAVMISGGYHCVVAKDGVKSMRTFIVFSGNDLEQILATFMLMYTKHSLTGVDYYVIGNTVHVEVPYNLHENARLVQAIHVL